MQLAARRRQHQPACRTPPWVASAQDLLEHFSSWSSAAVLLGRTMAQAKNMPYTISNLTVCQSGTADWSSKDTCMLHGMLFCIAHFIIV